MSEPPAPAALDVGSVIDGKYVIERVIGKGGMGTVVEARHRELGELVALKILHSCYLEHDEALARFRQEARAAAQIRGEHAARVLDVGTTPGGSPFLAMELLIGEDLAAVAERGPLDVARAVDYILQACEGMAEVHAHGIVHRDLKPGNLFVTSRPDGSPLIKLLDFGIAKNIARDPAIGSLTMTLVALGTPLYMAPEQVRSSRTVDARADVWSLGAILYELLSGQPAFGGNTVAHITAQVLEAHPPPLSTLRDDVPAGLDLAIRRALDKDAAKRWPDMAAFASALAPFAAREGAAIAARAARTLASGVFAENTPMTMSDDALEVPDLSSVDPRRNRRRVIVAGAGVGLGLALVVATAVSGSRTEAAKAQSFTAEVRQGISTAATWARSQHRDAEARAGSASEHVSVVRAAPEPVPPPRPETLPARHTSTALPPPSSATAKLLPPADPPAQPVPPPTLLPQSPPAADDFDPLGSRK